MTAGSAMARKKTPEENLEIPICPQLLGTVAIKDSQNEWWRQYNLGNPASVIKLIVMRSGCFQLVDRGQGMEMMRAERDLMGEDELQGGSGIGKGQMVAADYFILPDLVTQDSNTGGSAIGAGIGGAIGGGFGAMLGGIKTKKLEAQALLTLTNARTGVQELIAEGTYKKTDVSFGLGGGGWGGFGLALAAAGGGYADTDIGKVITLAYIKAYRNMVVQMGGLTDNPKMAAPLPAQRLLEPAPLLSQPDENAQPVRGLREGTLLYPTGNKSGLFWEVDEPNGERGWVSSIMFELAK
jgi:curli biogenesis system outer membrane secretion channel CsgG